MPAIEALWQPFVSWADADSARTLSVGTERTLGC